MNLCIQHYVSVQVVSLFQVEKRRRRVQELSQYVQSDHNKAKKEQQQLLWSHPRKTEWRTEPVLHVAVFLKALMAAPQQVLLMSAAPTEMHIAEQNQSV